MSGKNNIISQLEAEQMTKEIPAVSVCRRSRVLSSASVTAA